MTDVKENNEDDNLNIKNKLITADLDVLDEMKKKNVWREKLRR